MKFVSNILKVLLPVMFLAAAGCEQTYIAPLGKANKVLSIYTLYSPEKIEFTPLTEFIDAGRTQKQPVIRAYVSMLDSSGSQIKSPGVFRFELYQRLAHSADRKGKRIFIWPDIDLNDPVENANYWQDFLRAYRFDLDFMPQDKQAYILQVTCLGPNGNRILAEVAF